MSREHTIGRLFITAGDAIFTVASPDRHFTYRVTKREPDPNSRYTTPAYFVSLLTGSDNENDYTYMGMLEASSGRVYLTKASKYNAQSTPFKVVNWGLGLVWRGRPAPDGYSIHHEGRCGRCGRTLTHPESIVTGFGPDCIGMVGEQ